MTKEVVPRTHPSLRCHVINIVTHQSCLQVPQRRMGLVNNAPTALRFYWLIDLFGYLRIKIIDHRYTLSPPSQTFLSSPSPFHRSGCHSTPVWIPWVTWQIPIGYFTHGSVYAPGGGHGNPHQYSCLEDPHGQRSLAGYSPWGCKESNMTEQAHSTVYMLPCCSLHSSHPLLLLPRTCPYVCSLCQCLHCCPANRFISTIFLDSIYMC